MRVLVATIMVMLSCGCSTVERAEECQLVADTLNPSLLAMESVLLAKTPGWAALEAKSASLVLRLTALKLRDRALAQSVVGIATNLEALRREARFGSLAREKGEPMAEAGQQQVARILAKHSTYVREASKHCFEH